MVVSRSLGIGAAAAHSDRLVLASGVSVVVGFVVIEGVGEGVVAEL